MAHAKILRPSAASRWVVCTPSALLESEVEDKGSVYAREGNVAHALSELYDNIEYGFVPASEFEERRKSIEDFDEFYDEPMQEHVEEFVDFVKETYNEALAICPDPTIRIEHETDLSFIIPESFGTIDRLILGEGILWIIDLKYGKGVLVDAHKNKQLMIYALGAVREFGFLYTVKEVRMLIYQPRLHNYSEYTITTEELYHWAETELKEKAQLAFEGKGDFVAGPHCGFCKVGGRCKTRAEYYLELETFQSKAFLSVDEVASILDKLKSLKAWADSVEDSALEQALNGTQFPGYKVVEGRSNRRYTDPDKVAEAVLAEGWPEKDVYVKKVIALGAVEKLLGKKHADQVIGHLITKPQGKPALVPDTDARKPYNPSELDFKELLD